MTSRPNGRMMDTLRPLTDAEKAIVMRRVEIREQAKERLQKAREEYRQAEEALTDVVHMLEPEEEHLHIDERDGELMLYRVRDPEEAVDKAAAASRELIEQGVAHGS